jgi:hypothetical protein
LGLSVSSDYSRTILDFKGKRDKVLKPAAKKRPVRQCRSKEEEESKGKISLIIKKILFLFRSPSLIQEETTVLKVPCLTLRENTERPATVEAGSNIVAGTEPEQIVRCYKQIMKIDRQKITTPRSGTAWHPKESSKSFCRNYLSPP